MLWGKKNVTKNKHLPLSIYIDSFSVFEKPLYTLIGLQTLTYFTFKCYKFICRLCPEAYRREEKVMRID